MQFCTTCGRPRIGTARICTTCGTTFPGAAAADVTGADDDGRAGQQDAAESGRRQPGRRARPPTVSRPGIIAAIAVTIIAAGVGVALWLAGGHGSSRAGGPPGGSPAHGATPGAGSATATPRPSGAGDRSSAPATSRPATTPPATITSTGPVTVTRSAARHPQAHAIAAFLNRYFAAINSHDYQRYVALLSPEMAQRVTPDRFAAGFAATADSAETLTRIAPGDSGVTEAAVTFTSHQQPNAANHEESCTNWSISLFLRRIGRTYQIQTPPPGYRAGSTPCA
jgi:hypothetical protein